MIHLKLILITILSAVFILSACTTSEGQRTEMTNVIEDSSEDSDSQTTAVPNPVVETSELDNQPTTIPESIEDAPDILLEDTIIISTIKQELESKGWGDLETIEGEPDFRNRWRVIIEPTHLEEGSVLYCVIGHVVNDYYVSNMDYVITDQHISVIVKIIFHDITPDGEVMEAIYISESGRYLYGSDFEKIFNSDPNVILAADDEGLWSLMCAY